MGFSVQNLSVSPVWFVPEIKRIDGLMEEVCPFLGQEMTPELRATIKAKADKQRAYKSEHKYNLEKFGLSEEETRKLVQLAELEADRATSYYEFTSLINNTFTLDKKIKVVEMMWCVAFADNEMEKYEEHFVRKIAELLYVPHQDFIAAKLRAQANLG